MTKKLTDVHHFDGLPIVNFTQLAKVIAFCGNKEDQAIQTIFIWANKLENIDLKRLHLLFPKNTVNSCLSFTIPHLHLVMVKGQAGVWWFFGRFWLDRHAEEHHL